MDNGDLKLIVQECAKLAVEIDRMIVENESASEACYDKLDFYGINYHNGMREALLQVRQLLLGVGVKGD